MSVLSERVEGEKETEEGGGGEMERRKKGDGEEGSGVVKKEAREGERERGKGVYTV